MTQKGVSVHSLGAIRRTLTRRWKTGRYLADTAPTGSDELFPLRVAVPAPSAADMRDHFEEVRGWAAEYRAAESAGTAGPTQLTVEWTERNHRDLGRNRIPSAVIFPDIDTLAAFLGPGPRRRLGRYRAAAATLLDALPGLLSWVQSKPFRLLEAEPDLTRLIAVTRWLVRHPRPGIYIRQIPVPEADTKFVEANKAVLAAWWEALLPAEAIDRTATAGRGFSQRFGFRTRPELIRLRTLDAALGIDGFTDITVPIDELARWDPRGIERVFVLENDVTALAFPPVERGIVLFGRGYSAAALAAVEWLHRVQLYYWGDIDTHGYAILDRFRRVFPDVTSILMDRATLMAHEAQWVTEKTPTTVELPALTPAEREVYDDLRCNRIRHGIRLEQELISYTTVCRVLQPLGFNIR